MIFPNSVKALFVCLLSGIATAVGGAVVFYRGLVKLANRKFLSISLGFSAGVMLFLSYYEMFSESYNLLNKSSGNAKIGLLYAMLSYACGIIISISIDFFLHKTSTVEFAIPSEGEHEIERCVHGTPVRVHSRRSSQHVISSEQGEGHVIANPILSSQYDVEMQPVPTNEDVTPPTTGFEFNSISGNTTDLLQSDYYVDDDTAKSLQSVGIMSMVAITLHNLPEGIISYLTYLHTPAMGISLGIGIAAHNIPEGISIALPVYYSTHSRVKGFLWSLLSGLAEPAGAILCSVVLRGFVTSAMLGFMNGFVSGIMSYICVCELLPTGFKLSAGGNYTSIAFLGGVFFILCTMILMS